MARREESKRPVSVRFGLGRAVAGSETVPSRGSRSSGCRFGLRGETCGAALEVVKLRGPDPAAEAPGVSRFRVYRVLGAACESVVPCSDGYER